MKRSSSSQDEHGISNDIHEGPALKKAKMFVAALSAGENSSETVTALAAAEESSKSWTKVEKRKKKKVAKTEAKNEVCTSSCFEP